MKNLFAIVVAAALVVPLSFSAAMAQQKTVKACQDEWRANKEANQAAKITEKSYVEKCRGSEAAAAPAAPSTPAKSTAAPVTAAEKPSGAAQQKSAKACRDEWRANKEANRAAKITEKSYVEKCRGSEAVVAPVAPAAPSASGKSAAAPAPTTATPEKPNATMPAARQPAPTATSAVTGANQFPAESQAKGRCPSDTVVWVNTSSKIYHFAGKKEYGTTKRGAYMCEKDATDAGMRASKNEKRS